MIEQILASIVVGLVSGGFGTFVAVQVMKVEIMHLKERLDKVENKVYG